MKRSRHIHRDQMRKTPKGFNQWSPMTLAVIGASTLLSGCGDRSVEIQYNSLQDCLNDEPNNPKQAQMCKTAYQEAVDSSPKFNTESQCRNFGATECQYIQSANDNFWIPALAGFIVGKMANNYVSHFSHPVYSSNSYGSGSSFSRWLRDRHYDIGNYRQSTSHDYKTSHASKEKKAVTRTIARGGFGSKASAKSSWGGSRSRGWGG